MSTHGEERTHLKVVRNGRNAAVKSIGRRNTSNLFEEEVGHGDVTDLVHGETEG
jgi:hypothetical protein